MAGNSSAARAQRQSGAPGRSLSHGGGVSMRVSGALARGLIVLGCAATALLLGYFGLRTYVFSPQGKMLGLGTSWADILFDDVQLFVLQAPLNGTGPFTVSLQVARFLAPATTILAAVEALRVLLSEQLRSWKAASASK